MVIDVGNWQGSRWRYPAASGNPVSQHYDDQLRRYQIAQGILIPWTAQNIAAATEHTLRLQPMPAMAAGRENRGGFEASPVRGQRFQAARRPSFS
jgi:hypothetical protein